MLMIHMRYVGVTVVYFRGEHLWFNTSEKIISCLQPFLQATIVFLKNSFRSQCILVKSTSHFLFCYSEFLSDRRGVHSCVTKDLTGLCLSSAIFLHYDLVISHAKL